MPDQNLPSRAQYADDKVQLRVRPSESRVEVTAVADGCTATFDMSVMGAQRLSTMLDHAIVIAINRGLH